ncbi:MAG: B12-binding domain-containing radical SAM protein [Desulfatibacillaceae bacterium]
MRVAFIQDIWEELYGTTLLAEILGREGHEVRFFLDRRDRMARLRQWNPDVCGFYVSSASARQALEAAARVKAVLVGGTKVVFGGPHPTFFPEVIRHPAVDAVCRGEAERGFVQLLDGSGSGVLNPNAENFLVKVGGTITENRIGPLVADLDSLPIPRRSHYAQYPLLRDAPLKRVMSSRGCPFSCSYCYNEQYRNLVRGKGPYLRRRSVDNVIGEIEYLRDAFGMRAVEFMDDVFALDKKWLFEFAERYPRRVGLPYLAMVHARQVDEAVAEALAESGCSRIMFAIESASPGIRRDILRKDLSNGEIERCASLLTRYGVRFMTYNMVGAPTETEQDILDTIRLNQRLGPVYAWCSIAQPYAGTRLGEIARETGLMEEGAESRLTGSVFNRSILALPHKNRVENYHKLFGIAVRFPKTLPLIRRLVRLPANPVFRALHKLHYGWHTVRRNRFTLGHTLRLYWKYRKYY